MLAVSPAVAAGEHRAAEVDSVTEEVAAAAVVAQAASRAVDVAAPAASRGAAAAAASAQDVDGEGAVSAEVDEDTEQRLCVGHFKRVMVFLGLVWFSDGVKGVNCTFGYRFPLSISQNCYAIDVLCVMP